MEVLAPGGVPDPWLNFLAEVTGAVPLVALSVLFVVVYNRDSLSGRDAVGFEAVGLGKEEG